MGRYRYHLTMRAKDWRKMAQARLGRPARKFMQDSKNKGVTVFADQNADM